MTEEQSNLVMWLVMSAVVVLFVCSFVKTPGARFVIGFCLWVAGSIGVLRLQSYIHDEDFKAKLESETQVARNRRARIRGEEILPDGVTKEMEERQVGARAVARATPAPKPGDWMYQRSNNPLDRGAR